MPLHYAEAIEYIHNAKGTKAGLDNMLALLAALGNPERDFPSIHVAGTNGKGSICAFLHACLRQEGLRVGLYTSPYLQRYNERVRLGGLPISDEDLAALVTEIAEAAEARSLHPTTFELGTVLAFLYFARQRVDIAVIEVGLGGRLDPTNVLRPLVAVIGAIGRDHMHFLGEDIADIAWEKAGIIKEGVPTVLYPQGEEVRRVVREACVQQGSPLTDLAEQPLVALPIAQQGRYQQKNAAAAVAALRITGLVSEEAIMQGLAKAWWPGRLEWQGNVLLDGAHNEQGVQALAEYLAGRVAPEDAALVVGITGDKDIAPMVRGLSPLASVVIATQADNPRALSAEAVAEAFGVAGKEAQALSDPLTALDIARSLRKTVIVAGSLYLVGEARNALHLPVSSIP